MEVELVYKLIGERKYDELMTIIDVPEYMKFESISCEIERSEWEELMKSLMRSESMNIINFLLIGSVCMNDYKCVKKMIEEKGATGIDEALVRAYSIQIIDYLLSKGATTINGCIRNAIDTNQPMIIITYYNKLSQEERMKAIEELNKHGTEYRSDPINKDQVVECLMHIY